MKVCVIGLKKQNYSQELFNNFLNYLQSELPLSEDIRIVLTQTQEGKMTTGVREPNEIRVLASNRMLIDVLRTIIHEWVHEFQHQKLGVPDDQPTPEIGGPVENMASVLASIFLKKFQKKYPILSKKLYTEAVEDTIQDDSILKKDFVQSYKYNPEVAKLQEKLVAKKYYIGLFGKSKNGVDGKYGPYTQAAHQAFKDGIPAEEFNNKRAELAQEFIGDVDDNVLKNEFNFHKIPLGNNNYRSAQIPISISGKDYLGEVIDRYGIKTIIRFNGDGVDSRHTSFHPETPIQAEKELAQSKGINFYKLSSTRDQDKVNSLLNNGNVLIHCAHGADRTGGNVGGYLYKMGWGDTKKIWDYTTQYNGWKRMVKNRPNSFVKGGYLKQAQKFGVRDLDHARELLR